jgi:hypothetical protein
MGHSPVPWVWIIVIGFVVVCYVIALTRKGRVGITMIGSRRHELFVPLDAASVFARLQRVDVRYRIDDADPASKRLVLSSSPSLFTWGFLYPINIRDYAGGGSHIEVGIRSKVFQAGPLVTRAHQRCLDDLAQALGVPGTRAA